jgi:hypothetical protein
MRAILEERPRKARAKWSSGPFRATNAASLSERQTDAAHLSKKIRYFFLHHGAGVTWVAHTPVGHDTQL